MSFITNVAFGTIETTAMIVLSLTMFRFQFYYYMHKIFGTAFLMSLLSFLMRYNPQMNTYAILTALSIQIILIMIIYRIPFFYSLLVSVSGYTCSLLIELAVIFTGKKFSLLNEQSLQESAATLAVVQFSTALILSLVIYLLQRRKIGFLFKTKNLSSRTALKGYNFVVASLLVIGLLLTQIELVSFYQNKSISFFVIIIMAVIFLLGIFIAYKHNKSIIRETYERPVKDELDRSYRNETRSNYPKSRS
ncbi:cbb3-type cytochrome oxidase subunit 3 [Paenibacillus mucilaginosus]